MRNYYKKLLPPVMISVIGLIIFFIINSYPEIIPAMYPKSGYVWSPINSADLRIGDSYYYAAWVQEVINGNIPPLSPSTIENKSKPSVEIFKIVPIMLASFPGLFIKDNRWVYVISKFFFIACYFVFGFYISRYFVGGYIVPVLIGVFFLWYYDFLQFITFNTDFFSNLSGIFLRYKNIIHFEFTSDRYRYINTSVVNAFTLLFFSSLIIMERKLKIIFIFTSALLGFLLIFNYFPQALVSYLVILFLFLYWFVKKDFKKAIFFGCTGILIIILLLVTNINKLFQEASNNTIFLQPIFTENFNVSTMANYFFSFKAFQTLLFNSVHRAYAIKYTAIFLPAFFLTKSNSSLRSYITALGCTCLVLLIIASMTGNINVINRFFIRGIDSVWPLFMIIAIFYGLKKHMPAIILKNKSINIAVGIASILILIYFPIFGFYKFGKKNINNFSRNITEDQWDIYDWINKNTPNNTNILATEWHDIYLLPVYTHANIAYGHWILNNRPSIVEVERFFATWKLFGLSRNELKILISNSLNNYNKLNSSYSTTPFVDYNTFQSSMFLHAFFYWPFIKAFDYIPISKNNLINDDFIDCMMSTYDKVDVNSTLKNAKINYIIMQNRFGQIPKYADFCNNFKIIYSNKTRYVCSCNN